MTEMTCRAGVPEESGKGTTPGGLETPAEGGVGLGRYRRHNVAHACAAAEFIRTAPPPEDWVERYELSQASP